MSAAPAHRRAPRLHERDEELAELGAALAAAAAGEGRLLLVEGAAGSGKSSLLARAVGEAGARGFTVLRASGSELERAFAYGAVRQLLEPTIAAAHAERRAALLAGAAAPAAWVLGAEAGEADRAGALFATLHALYWLVAALARDGPVALVVDDLHWVDDASARWLLYLARRLDDLPVFLAAAVRPDEPGAPAAPLAELAAQPGAVRLAPRPLTLAASTAIAREQLGDVAEDVGVALHDESAGNPLYLRELLRAVAAAPTAEAVRAASVASLGDRVLARVARVGAGAAELARAVAVLGDGTSLSLAAALADVDEPRAAQLARHLVRLEVLAGDDPCAFVHPLVRRSVSDGLSVVERREAHTRAAALLRERGAPAQAIAVHLAALQPAGAAETARTLAAAADEALARAAPQAAIGWLERALAEAAADPSPATLQLALARAKMAVRDPSAPEHMQRALGLAADARTRVTAAVALAEMLAMAAQWDAALSLLAAELARLGEDEPELRAELEAVRAVTLANTAELRQRFDADRPRLQAVAATTDGWPAAALEALFASTAAIDGEPAERVAAFARRSLDRGVLARDAGGWAVFQTMMALVIVEHHDEALAVAQAVEEAGRDTGSLLALAGAGATRGYVHTRRGELADAEAVLRSLRELVVTLGIPMWLATFYFQFVDALVERTTLDDVADELERLEVDERFVRTGAGTMLIGARGRVRRARGDRAGALADLRASAAVSASLHHHAIYLPWRSELALALPEADADEARALVRDELAEARAGDHPRAIGVALRAAGMLAGGQPGIALLEEAVATLAGTPARLEHARALVELGAALRRGGRRVEAREPLLAGRDLAHRCGAQRLAARAGEELAAAGARPRRIALHGVEALTPSELRVARLAAEGRRNVEIAQELFVSRKTVETHLSNAYAKLGLSGQDARAALAGALAA